MKKMLPESELARDERFVRSKIEDRIFDPRGAKLAPAQHRSGQDGDRPARRGRALPLADARHLRGRDPGARGRGPHLLRLRRHRGAVPAQARHGPPVLGRVAALRDLDQARRPHGHRDRRVHREHVPLLRRVQPRPGAAPLRRQPCARRPRHRRVQHDEGIRQRVGRPGARVLRGLDARRRGDPREDGLRLAAPPHRQAIRSGASVRSSSSARSTASSTSAASAARTRRTSIQLARRFRQLAGFTDEENDSLATLARESTEQARQMAEMAGASFEAQNS